MKSIHLTTITTALLLSCAAAQADLSISSKPTQNMTCEAGICTATAQKAVLNVIDLQTMLSSGDVSVKTGSIAINIEINQPLNWTSTSRLTLDAQRTIAVKKRITAGGSGAVTIVYAHGDSNGDLQFVEKGTIDLPNPASTLIINGSAYTLVYDIAGLANGVVSNPNGQFALAADYDATNQQFKDSPILSFAGTFEGLGHAISRLTINYRGPDHNVGFLGVVTGVVRDLLLRDEKLNANDAYFAGGLVGTNLGQIIHARATGKISGDAQYAGGLVGYNVQQILRSSASMTIKAKAVGGLVGDDDAVIDQCFATGRMLGAAGGLVAFESGQPKISNSYASAQIPEGIGGLIGTGMIYVSSSYSTSEVPTGSAGFVGSVWKNQIQNGYWDIDTSGTTVACSSGDCSGITGLADAQLKAGLPSGFDPNIWNQSPDINNGYPYLLANPPPKGQ